MTACVGFLLGGLLTMALIIAMPRGRNASAPTTRSS